MIMSAMSSYGIALIVDSNEQDRRFARLDLLHFAIVDLR